MKIENETMFGDFFLNIVFKLELLPFVDSIKFKTSIHCSSTQSIKCTKRKLFFIVNCDLFKKNEDTLI